MPAPLSITYRILDSLSWLPPACCGWPRNSFTANKVWPWTHVHGIHLSHQCTASPDGMTYWWLLIQQFSTSGPDDLQNLCDLIFLNAVVSAMTQGLSAINRFLSFFFWSFNIVKVEINVWTGLQCTFFKRKIVSNGKAYSKILCSAKPFRLRLYSNICKQ